MNDRTKRLTDLFGSIGIDAAIVMSYENLRYLSGFTGGEAMLFISAKDRVLFTDSRYTEQAQSQAPDYSVVLCNQFVREHDRVKELLGKNIRRIGFESDKVTVDWLESYKNALPEVEFVPVPGEIDKLRWTKESVEIEAIQHSQDVTDEAFLHMLKMIKVGMSEYDIRSELEYFMAKRGGYVSFDSIIASGPHASMPHAQPTSRKVQNGDFLTMDFGCKLDGYCSDMTRTVAIGEPTQEMAKVYQIVLKAQQIALDKIGPGMVCKDVDNEARSYIAQSGYEECFGHGLGHGFGLMIHEEPRLSPFCGEVLTPGICMSVEPGIYLAGRFGVRIEDTVCITETGYKNFTHSPKELIIL